MTTLTRTRARKGDRAECPECHRYVGYWPDKLNPYLAHLMPHRLREGLYGRPAGPWCERRTKPYRGIYTHGIESLSAHAKRHLQGRDLACWCRLDHPCHADVLLELANA